MECKIQQITEHNKRNRLTDIQNKLVDTSGEREEEKDTIGIGD